MYDNTATYVNKCEEIPNPYLLKSLSTYNVVKTFKFLNTEFVIIYTIIIFLNELSFFTNLNASNNDNFFFLTNFLFTKPTLSSSYTGISIIVCGLGCQNR